MSELHKKEQIENYEESWQRLCYFPCGDGTYYVHACELCGITSDVQRIPGGHYLCSTCKKGLRLLKEKSIPIRGQNMIEGSKNIHLELCHPADPSKRERKKAWKEIIKMDYLVALFNEHFKH